VKILFLVSDFPKPDGEAVEMICFEMVRFLLQAGHAVHVQVLIKGDSLPPHSERQEMVREHWPGVAMEPSIFLNPSGKREKAGKWSRFFRSLPIIRSKIYPPFFLGAQVAERVQSTVDRVCPDILLSLWSNEALAACHAVKGVPKWIYYGNPDPVPQAARLARPDLFGSQKKGFSAWIEGTLARMENRAKEVQHLAMIRSCDAVANDSTLFAEYYAAHGHKKTFYLKLWHPARSAPVFGGVSCDTPKIVASVGHLGATGNTFGLWYLGRELLPFLETRFGKSGLKIAIIGKGEPVPTVKPLLEHPLIHRLGWVENIEKEICGSALFLILTNATGFLVPNTRILLGWSLGACVLAHANSALSMPEMRHKENCLLAATPQEMAETIAWALDNPDERERIGRAGFELFSDRFHIEKVMPELIDNLEVCACEFRSKKLANRPFWRRGALC